MTRQPSIGEFKVVLNVNQQYSLWPAQRPNPPGWEDNGVFGSKDECLRKIKESWSDMTPLSLRKREGK